MEVEGQKAAGVEAGVVFPQRVELTRIASERSERVDQRFPKVFRKDACNYVEQKVLRWSRH